MKPKGRYPAKQPNLSRDFNSPEYKAWRKEVFKRDGFSCVLCGAGGYLKCHHIKRWANFPTLRYDVKNGCTLCQKCHVKVTGNEDAYAPMLMRKLNQQRRERDKEAPPQEDDLET